MVKGQSQCTKFLEWNNFDRLSEAHTLTMIPSRMKLFDPYFGITPSFRSAMSACNIGHGNGVATLIAAWVAVDSE